MRRPRGSRISTNQATSQVVVFFELADMTYECMKTVHSFNWFKQTYINNKTVCKIIIMSVTAANDMLFADGHVEAISDQQIREWALKPYKFVPVRLIFLKSNRHAAERRNARLRLQFDLFHRCNVKSVVP